MSIRCSRSCQWTGATPSPSGCCTPPEPSAQVTPVSAGHPDGGRQARAGLTARSDGAQGPGFIRPNDRKEQCICAFSATISCASYPLTCRPADVLANQRYNRLYNYYCTDVQARGAYPAYAHRLLEELGVHLDIRPGDAEILQKGTVDFITFSYYMSSCQTAGEAKSG